MPNSDANSSALLCYRCGTSLADLSLPLSRLDLCPSCSVELHVCRMCRHYAPSLPDACSEDDAIEVSNKTAANFCDYFSPSMEAFDGRERRAEAAAKQQLDALFGSGDSATGDESKPADQALEEAEKLFRK